MIFSKKHVEDGIYLRVPQVMPKEILVGFSEVFLQHKFVRWAYLAEGYMQSGEPVHYIIGIKTDLKNKTAIEILIEGLSNEISKFVPSGLYVDFVELGNMDTIVGRFMSDYVIPFYTAGDG